jgi:hypothetical protein
MAIPVRVASELGGIDRIVYSSDRSLTTAVILALRNCTEHIGVHHFAVIGEGHEVAVSLNGYQCLISQGVELDG